MELLPLAVNVVDRSLHPFLRHNVIDGLNEAADSHLLEVDVELGGSVGYLSLAVFASLRVFA